MCPFREGYFFRTLNYSLSQITKWSIHVNINGASTKHVWYQGRIQGEKIWFFGVKSWFFTRNTPNNFAPPSARRNFFKCAPPPPFPNLKSWMRPWICYDSSNTIVRCCIYLTTYDWIKPFLKITIEGRAIYGNLENKINTLYWPV